MLLNFYILRQLAAEWGDADHHASLVQATVEESWSSSADELTVRFTARDGQEFSLRISVRPGLSYIFRQPGAGKPRKNTTPLFKSLNGQEVRSVRVADRDRVLDLEMRSGLILRCLLFGSSANVLLLHPEEGVREAFREKAAARGIPESRPAPDPQTSEELKDRWPKGALPLSKAVNKAFPLFDRWLAEELTIRAALDIHDGCLAEDHHLEVLLDQADRLRAELLDPRPVLYREDREPIALTLIPLSKPPGAPQELPDADEAVRLFTRATLSQRGFQRKYDPLRQALDVAAAKAAQTLASMEKELSRSSRADQYERWGHLLMAAEAGAPAGRKSVSTPDLFGDGAEVCIPLDPSLTGLENANRFYDRARRSRRAREEALRRVDAARQWAEETASMAAALAEVEDLKGLKRFEAAHVSALAQLRGKSGKQKDGVPFRTFQLTSGDTVWVGRNARQNDQLTFKHARKHDLWMHARGIAGSHTVLKRDNKTRMPPKPVLEEAAAIAAWYSKARGSALVPVIVTERKYVRSPRKAAPGAVLVDREEVLLVPPGLPAGYQD